MVEVEASNGKEWHVLHVPAFALATPTAIGPTAAVVVIPAEASTGVNAQGFIGVNAQASIGVNAQCSIGVNAPPFPANIIIVVLLLLEKVEAGNGSVDSVVVALVAAAFIMSVVEAPMGVTAATGCGILSAAIVRIRRIAAGHLVTTLGLAGFFAKGFLLPI